VFPYFTSCNHFFIPSGKSTVLSYLAGEDKFGLSEIFRKRNRLQQKEVVGYMSTERILFIEMPSVFNGTAAADLIAHIPPQGTLETTIVVRNVTVTLQGLFCLVKNYFYFISCFVYLRRHGI